VRAQKKQCIRKNKAFGLAIAKHIIEATNSTVKFESEKRQGTKFILQFST
jgi:signal transduction histidine kinase